MARIAVVNDDTTFLTLMATLLDDHGWETLVLREGDTAYEVIKREQPDLVIMDVRLERPEEGWQVIELLTLDPETEHIPIIVCSAALDDLRTREDWLRQHGIESLPKPFDIDDLYSGVEASLARGQTSR